MKKLTAIICLTLTLLLGSTGVSWSADYQKGLTAAMSGDFATALREWKPLAEQGNAGAQNSMGVLYERGQGVPQDYKTAAKWWKLSAAQGNAFAQKKLSILMKKMKAPANKNRGMWGLKFGMSSTVVGTIKNNKIDCDGITHANLLQQFFQCMKGKSQVSLEYTSKGYCTKEKPCQGLKSIELSRGDYTNSGWIGTLKKLKSIYKIVKSPSAEEIEKFGFGSGMLAPDLKYYFENTKNKRKPKFLIYGTKSSLKFTGGYKKVIFIRYITEKEGNKIVGAIRAKKKADDDL